MKKLSAMVMAGVMALGMVGCGSTAAEAPAESTVPAAESTAAETTESTAEAQTETADAQTEAGRQFVVTAANMSALTWIWHRRFATDLAGHW